MVNITIRDGRAECELAPDGKGAVLGNATIGDFLDIGGKIALPDGTPVIVIGSEETLSGQGSGQVVFVGSMPDRAAD